MSSYLSLPFKYMIFQIFTCIFLPNKVSYLLGLHAMKKKQAFMFSSILMIGRSEVRSLKFTIIGHLTAGFVHVSSIFKEGGGG